MGDLGEKVDSMLDEVSDYLSPSVPLAVIVGASTFLGTQEFMEYLRERDMLSSFLAPPLTAILYGGTAFQEVLLRYNRFHYRKVFRRFMEKTTTRVKQMLADSVMAWLPATALTFPMITHRYMIDRMVSDSLSENWFREDLPSIVLNTTLFVVPFGHMIYRMRQRKRGQKIVRLLAMRTAHYLAPEKARVQYDAANARHPSAFLHSNIAMEQARLGNIEEACLSLLRGYAPMPEEPALQTAFGRGYYAMGLAAQSRRVKRQLKKQPRDLKFQLQKLILHTILGDKQDLLQGLKGIVAEHRYNDHHDNLRLLYALALREDGQHKEARQEFAAATESLLAKGEGLRAVAESAHAVLEYEPSAFIRNVIIIKRGPYAQLETEGHWTRQIREMLHDQPVWHVPEVLAVVDKDTESYLVMKRGHGKHLEEIDAVDVYARAAYLVAYLHAHMPQAWSQIGRRPIAERTRNSLRNAHFFPAVGEDVLRTILQNYRPVYNAVTALPDAVNVDAHPRNILLLEDGSLLKMDNEDRGISPLGFDVANLMRGRADMNPIMTAYWDAYEKYQGGEKKPKQRIEEKQFRLGCLASVVHRSIAFASAWSQPHLADMRGKRKGVLEWGINAIDEIYRSHAAHFAAYQREYTALQRSLDSITHRLAAGA